MRLTRLAICVAVLLSAVFAGEPPDLEYNPSSGFVEGVDIATDSDDRVRHVADAGQGGWRSATLVSEDAGASPRLAIDSAGDTWVVWWHDGAADEIKFAVRDGSIEQFGTVRRVSASTEQARNPEIVHDGLVAWVAYEVTVASGTTITVASVIDSPEPVGSHSDLRTTAFAGDTDVLAHGEAGHVWVTWVDSATTVGWSEYLEASESWSAAQYESYASNSVATAREAIRDAVLAP